MRFTDWLTALRRCPGRRVSRRNRPGAETVSVPASVEHLEDRTLLSITIVYAIDVDDPGVSRTLDITIQSDQSSGSPSDDEIVVRADPAGSGLVQVVTRDEPNGLDIAGSTTERAK